MVNSCCVRGCNNESYPGSHFSFHGFPKNENQKLKWQNVVPGKISKSSVVCSAHFKCDDFVSGYIRRMLKPDAVPSIFPKVVSSEKRIHVLSKIRIQEGPALKTIKLQESVTKELSIAESISTQTVSAATSATPRKKKLRREVKVLQQRLKRRNTTIDNLKCLLKIIKKKCDNYSEVEQMVQHNFENIHTNLNTTKSKKSNKYTDEMKSFALSLYYYSGKAYLFLRNRIPLPHPATLRRILSTHKCNVGFMTEVMEFLKAKAENGEINVALIFDAMAIKASKQYDKGSDKYWGGVNLGGILTSDSEKFATEALVFQIVSLKEKFACPIAYFFIDKISAHVQSQLILTAIRMLSDINIVVRSLTADGTQVNIKTFEILGCNFTLANIKTYFDHQIKGVIPLYCILDPAHMIKLARNLFAETCLSSEKGDIKFEFIQKLHDLQEEEGLKLKNKLTRVHVDFFGKKMNVKLAAQVLSSSVADAIDYLRSIGHPSFAGSEATVEYLRYLDRLFDILNAKNPVGVGFKSPLHLQNKHVWTQVFEETRQYLTKLKVDGKNVMTHRRKTPVLGLIIDTYSFAELASEMFDAGMTYLLPYKASQDHIEMFFSCVRARGGTNDNPTALEFMFIMRKLLFRNSVRPSVNANCTNLDYENSAILEFRSAKRSIVEDNNTKENETDKSDVLMHLMDRTNLSNYKNNILYYISGYIAMKILDKLTCEHCRALLISHRTHRDHDYLIDKIKRISHVHPSSDESHELELIKCIGQKYLSLRLKSYGKSLTLKHMGDKATLRQKLHKTVLFSNV
ncbi:unnamed protein product [Euphydryas editha]|uniref:THAP-type domain-containing protein n=1 Tax=Euphydryas editha TaxID=104508 RepID=A0AAU9U2D8_EUPED|nr:unnamed protein product [Euphydryas editha]